MVHFGRNAPQQDEENQKQCVRPHHLVRKHGRKLQYINTMSAHSRAERFLACALTYRDAPERTSPLPEMYSDVECAIEHMLAILLHEAHEAMQTPMPAPPEHPVLHPVDVDTTEPGIVDEKNKVVRHVSNEVPRVIYRIQGKRRRTASPPSSTYRPTTHATMSAVDAENASRVALEKTLNVAEKKAATSQRREVRTRERADERKREREEETPEQRQTRLREAKEKREARVRAKQKQEEEEGNGEQTVRVSAPKKTVRLCDDALLVHDVSVGAVMRQTSLRKRKPGTMQFFEHPLPHHRHLQALQECIPHANLLPALLSGESCDDFEIIQGPPGTGKTRALVQRIGDVSREHRILLCAPTNVGAANLYARCISEGYGDECALALAPERIPPGTPLLSNDPSRRIVCSTVSARAGPALHTRDFHAVFVDEAAQCMEAWVWTLLRPEVSRLVLAGDVHQLPARVSESGLQLRHERSLMERLVMDLKYDNVVTLTEQNRMAPALVAFPNSRFYGGALITGPHAPTQGTIELRIVSDGAEETVGTSLRNRAEAVVAAEIATEDANAVLITPYAGQCQLLLAQQTGREVHTVDSFQGREADTIVLSVVRDGTHGLGFWSDSRRLTVALTRARRRLVVVASGVERWPGDADLTAFVSSLTCTS